MIPAIKVPLSLDLTEFTQFLWMNEIPHRVTEEEDAQIIWVSPRVSTERIQQLFDYWRSGQSLNQIQVRSSAQSGMSQFSPERLAKLPVVMSLILLSVCFSLLIHLGDQYAVMNWLSFTGFQIRGDQLYYDAITELIASGELWRIWTPIFLHFSLLHILFNLLWVWVIGQRIELLQGGMRLLMLVLFSGALSNLAQFAVSGPLFGGMSGVVFALLAYVWTWDKLSGRPFFGFPSVLMGFMLFWLALGFTGALESVGLGAIANTAHLVGLIAGVVFALLVRMLGFHRKG